MLIFSLNKEKFLPTCKRKKCKKKKKIHDCIHMYFVFFKFGLSCEIFIVPKIRNKIVKNPVIPFHIYLTTVKSVWLSVDWTRTVNTYMYISFMECYKYVRTKIEMINDYSFYRFIHILHSFIDKFDFHLWLKSVWCFDECKHVENI